MRASRVSLLGLTLILGLIFSGATAPAMAQGYIGLTGGFYQPEESEADLVETYGIRGGYRFNPQFGFEASLTQLDLADSLNFEELGSIFFEDFNFKFDITNLDLSAQWYPRGGNFVVFAGPGVAWLDSEVSLTFFGERFSESESETIFTAHAGLGYSWLIGERFFIRPEARIRSYFDDEIDEDEDVEEGLGISYKATDYEVGLTFGWRF